MKKTLNAFTLVEVTIVITVIAILATIGIVAFGSIQKQTRDTSRESNTQLIAEALEKYYEKNGEYPSCEQLQQDPASANYPLEGINANVLRTPTATTEVTSISCNDMAEPTDVFAYVGDMSTGCRTSGACSGWVIRYLNETTGEIKEIASRHAVPVPLSAPTTPTMTLVGGDSASSPITATAAAVSCTTGTVQYKIDTATTTAGNYTYSWVGGTWGTERTATVASPQRYVKYVFQATARCVQGTESATSSTSPVVSSYYGSAVNPPGGGGGAN